MLLATQLFADPGLGPHLNQMNKRESQKVFHCSCWGCSHYHCLT